MLPRVLTRNVCYNSQYKIKRTHKQTPTLRKGVTNVFKSRVPLIRNQQRNYAQYKLIVTEVPDTSKGRNISDLVFGTRDNTEADAHTLVRALRFAKSFKKHLDFNKVLKFEQRWPEVFAEAYNLDDLSDILQYLMEAAKSADMAENYEHSMMCYDHAFTLWCYNINPKDSHSILMLIGLKILTTRLAKIIGDTRMMAKCGTELELLNAAFIHLLKFDHLKTLVQLLKEGDDEEDISGVTATVHNEVEEKNEKKAQQNQEHKKGIPEVKTGLPEESIEKNEKSEKAPEVVGSVKESVCDNDDTTSDGNNPPTKCTPTV